MNRNKIQEWIQQFMSGRYGMDQLSKTLSYAVVILILLGMFGGSSLLELIAIGLLVYAYFRMFSRNYEARRKENEAYLRFSSQIRTKWNRFWKINSQRKDYHIYTCPNQSCSQKIRIPRGKGKIEVTCPKCGTKFVKNS